MSLRLSIQGAVANVLILIALLGGPPLLNGAPDDSQPLVGAVDPSFHPDLNGQVEGVIVQPDGRMIIWGRFSRINGVTQRWLARLHPNGGVDTSFRTEIDGPVDAVGLMVDGRIIVSGTFERVNGVRRPFLARLFPDGSLDVSLNAGTDWFSPGYNRPYVNKIVPQTDGKILVGGGFTSISGITNIGVARLNGDGSLDPSFTVSNDARNHGGPATIYDFAFLPNGGLLLAGTFDTYQGRNRNGLVQLLPDGAVDESFQAGLQYPNVYQLKAQPDGKALVGGPSMVFSGVTRQGVARLGRDGSLDLAFDPGTTLSTDTLAFLGPILPDGRLVVISYSIPILLLDTNGQRATNFVAPIAPSAKAVALAIDGQLIVGGNFSNVPELTEAYLAELTLRPVPEEQRVEFNQTDCDVKEAAGAIRLNVVRTGPATNSISVEYTILAGESATAGVDYILTAGTLTWGVGDRADQEITIQLLDDPAIETDEEFVVELRHPVGALLGSRTTSAVMIHDNERPARALDNSFQPAPATFAGGFVGFTTFALQPDGKLIVAGAFDAISGVPRSGIARLNQDGTLDLAYEPPGVMGVYAVTVQPNGSALIAGRFNFAGGSPHTNVARILNNGTIDPTFNGNLSYGSSANTMVLQPDGSVLIGGSVLPGSGVSAAYLVRLLANGQPDPAFHPPALGYGAIRTLVLQPDHKILVLGDFETYVGATPTPQPGLVRLNADGTLDSTFALRAETSIYLLTSVLLEPDGHILLAGLTLYASTPFLVRLNADGTLDPSFQAPRSSGFYGNINALLRQNDGKIVVVGLFETVGDVPRRNIARLLPDGELDPSFNPGRNSEPIKGWSEPLILDRDGAILVAGASADPAESNSLSVVRLWPDVTWNTIEFRTGAQAANEDSGGIEVLIERGGESSLPVSVEVQWAGGTATLGSDFSFSNSTVFFAPLEVRKTFPLLIQNDDYLEGVETIELNLRAVSAPVHLGVITGTIVAIHDDETAPSNLDETFARDAVFRAFQPTDKIFASFRHFLFRYGGTTNEPAFETIAAELPGYHGLITTVLLQPDGKVLFGGYFDHISAGTNTLVRPGFARANADGSLDPTFNPQIASTYGVGAIALQPDGKIVVGGGSDLISQVSTGFARLFPDGTLDTNFTPQILSGIAYTRAAVALQPDGKVLVGGNIYSVNGVTRHGLARLNDDGSLDAEFAPAATGGFYTTAGINALVVDPGGDILIGGDFRFINGRSQRGIARLHADGALDSSFDPGTGVDGMVKAILVQPDRRLVIAGLFTTVNGQPRPAVAQLNDDGSVDIGFAPALPPYSSAETLGRQPDGAILVGGEFCDRPPSDDDDGDYFCVGTIRLLPEPGLAFLGFEPMTEQLMNLRVSVFPGRRYRLEQSVDLVHWSMVLVIIPTQSSAEIALPGAHEGPQRFYRLVEIGRH